MRTNTRFATPGLIALSVMLPLHMQAATVTWTGAAFGNSNWSDSTNWDGNGSGTAGIPGASDTVIINNGDTVFWDTPGNLPSNLDITLSGNSGLDGSSLLRASGSTFTVSSGSELSGGFWDFANATVNFVDGSLASMSSWEHKGTSTFNFTLSSSGFTALNPASIRVDANDNARISTSTYNVDMASYTGGAGTITLVDFDSNPILMTNAIFQTATLNVTNTGAFNAEIVYNESTDAVELNVSLVPEPSSTALLGLGGMALLLRRQKRC